MLVAFITVHLLEKEAEFLRKLSFIRNCRAHCFDVEKVLFYQECRFADALYLITKAFT